MVKKIQQLKMKKRIIQDFKLSSAEEYAEMMNNTKFRISRNDGYCSSCKYKRSYIRSGELNNKIVIVISVRIHYIYLMSCDNPKCNCKNCNCESCGCDGSKDCVCAPSSTDCCCNN